MTIFELICGGLSIESITSYNKIILFIYGLSFTFISILLFSTLTAIISSHYFEYYANQGDLNANFIKLFLKNFISKEGSDGPIEHLGFFKSILVLTFRYIKRWVWSIQKTKEEYKETSRYVKQDEKYESRDIKLRIQKDVREVIKNSMDDESFMEKNVSANKVKLHFWVSLIDNILSRSASKGFFFSLFNQKYNLFDVNFKIYENRDDDSDYSDNEITTFLVLNFEDQSKLWDRADIKKKMQYWEAIQNHIESLYEDNEISYTDRSINSSRCLNSNIQRDIDEYSNIEDQKSHLSINHNNSQFEPTQKVREDRNTLHIKLWKKCTDQDSKFNLWFKLFKPKHRAFLWNSLEFSFSYFETVSTSEVATPRLQNMIQNYQSKRIKDSFNGNQVLESLSNKELFQLAIVFGKYNSKTEYVSKEEPNTLKQKKIFKHVYWPTQLTDDFKSSLWIPLTLKQKFELYMKCSHFRERELLSLAFMYEFKLLNEKENTFFLKEINNIKIFDKYAEGTLSNLLYEKFMKICENQRTKAQINKIEETINNNKINCVQNNKHSATGEPGHQNDHFDFIKFLNHIYEKSNEVLRDERDEVDVKLKYFLRLKRKEY